MEKGGGGGGGTASHRGASPGASTPSETISSTSEPVPRWWYTAASGSSTPPRSYAPALPGSTPGGWVGGGWVEALRSRQKPRNSCDWYVNAEGFRKLQKLPDCRLVQLLELRNQQHRRDADSEEQMASATGNRR